MPLKIGTPLPALTDVSRWWNVNGEFSTPPGPILVHFWAMSCPVCKMNLPVLNEYRDRYGPLGLSFISVHMPRGPFDLDTGELEEALCTLQMTEPCAADNRHVLGQRFDTEGMWPVYYLFDHDSRLKRYAAGTIGVRLLAPVLERLFSRGICQEFLSLFPGLFRNLL
ncbi:MAG: TlpA disulfide reductase family protein [Capsulimonadales bacterium]|nr:TlpA disulfide reductase family protein [Capsulimonadales bacterium]